MIVVSACLAGIRCRYNGQPYPVSAVAGLLEKGCTIPLCPEVLGGLPIPRMSVEQVNGRLLTAAGEDVTGPYMAGAEAALAIARLAGCTAAVLKSRSPTCGCGEIYDGTFTGRLRSGDGIFCIMLKNEGISVYTESDLTAISALAKERTGCGE